MSGSERRKEKGESQGEGGSKRQVGKYEKNVPYKKKREGRGGRENVGGEGEGEG